MMGKYVKQQFAFEEANGKASPAGFHKYIFSPFKHTFFFTLIFIQTRFLVAKVIFFG